MSFDFSQVDRLEGSDPNSVTSSGLIKKKKPEDAGDEIIFKKPKTSLFGLDKLASEKRKEKEAAESSNQHARDRRDKTDRERHRNRDGDTGGLRKPRIETPSFTGGVSDDYEKRRREKEDKERDRRRGIKVSSHGTKVSSHSSDRHGRRLVPTPSRSGWEDDDFDTNDRRSGSRSGWTPRDGHSSRSGWDTPRNERTGTPRATPTTYGTPRATPITYETSSRSRRYHADRSTRSERSSLTGGRTDPEEEVDEEELRMRDRAWYDEDADHDPFGKMSEEFVMKKEEMLKKSKIVERISAQQRQINKDNEKWETNRLLLSGVVTKTNVTDDDDDQLSLRRVHLMVHNIVPPFLDGRILFTKQPEPVIPVKDSTSDMAILSKKGSQLVKYHREMKERKRAQKKEWELAGTKIGDIMGIQKPKDETDSSESSDYKTDQRFKDHMDTAQTDREKITKQRQFLPVYACRSELLNIIRDNSIVIIVGETGSGKTTQLTQVNLMKSYVVFFINYAIFTANFVKNTVIFSINYGNFIHKLRFIFMKITVIYGENYCNLWRKLP